MILIICATRSCFSKHYHRLNLMKAKHPVDHKQTQFIYKQIQTDSVSSQTYRANHISSWGQEGAGLKRDKTLVNTEFEFAFSKTLWATWNNPHRCVKDAK